MFHFYWPARLLKEVPFFFLEANHFLPRFLGIFKLPNVMGGMMMPLLRREVIFVSAALTSSCWVSLGYFQEKIQFGKCAYFR